MSQLLEGVKTLKLFIKIIDFSDGNGNGSFHERHVIQGIRNS